MGDTIEDHGFYGWRNPVQAGFDTHALETIYLHDFYDPTASTNTKLVMVDLDTRWCAYSRQDYSEYEQGNYEAYSSKGVEFLGVLFEGLDVLPATPLDLQQWGQKYQVTLPLAIDPQLWAGHFIDLHAAPLHLLIDRSNMKIQDELLGGTIPDLMKVVDATLAGN